MVKRSYVFSCENTLLAKSTRWLPARVVCLISGCEFAGGYTGTGGYLILFLSIGGVVHKNVHWGRGLELCVHRKGWSTWIVRVPSDLFWISGAF